MDRVIAETLFFGCVFSFGVFVTFLNKNITQSLAAKKLSWCIIWGCVFFMVIFLFFIRQQVGKV